MFLRREQALRNASVNNEKAIKIWRAVKASVQPVRERESACAAVFALC